MFVVPCFHRTAGHSTVLVTMIMTCLGHIVYWRANKSFLMVFRSSCSHAQCTVCSEVLHFLFVVPCFHRTAGHSTVLVTMIMTCLGHIVYWRANKSFLMVFRSSCSYAQCTVCSEVPHFLFVVPCFHRTAGHSTVLVTMIMTCLGHIVYWRANKSFLMVFRSSCSHAQCTVCSEVLHFLFVVPCFHRTAGHSTVLVTMIMTCLGHIVYRRANKSFFMVFRSSCSSALHCHVLRSFTSYLLFDVCCPLFSQDSRSFHSTSDYDHDMLRTYSLLASQWVLSHGVQVVLFSCTVHCLFWGPSLPICCPLFSQDSRSFHSTSDYDHDTLRKKLVHQREENSHLVGQNHKLMSDLENASYELHQAKNKVL